MHHSRTKRGIGLVAALVMAASGLILGASPAQAQEQTGATATKECPSAPAGDPYTIGDTVVCTATFTNAWALQRHRDRTHRDGPVRRHRFAEQRDTRRHRNCTLNGTTTIIDEGDTLPAGATCTATFGVTIPDDPALCNTVFRDRVEIALSYPQFNPPLDGWRVRHPHAAGYLCAEDHGDQSG